MTARPPAGVLDRVPDPCFALDAAWRFRYLNERAERLFDDAEALRGQVIWDAFPATVETPLPDAVHRAVEEGKSAAFEFGHPDTEESYAARVHPTDDGVWVLLLDGTEAEADGGEAIVPDTSPGAASPTSDPSHPTGEDVHLLDRVTDAFFALDSSWRFTYLNDRAETLLERSREGLLGQVIWDEFPETVETQFPDGFYRAMETGEPVAFEVYHTPLETWFEARAYPGEDGVSVSLRDVTERKERERQLERYETMIQAAGDPIFTLDATGEVTDANDAMVEFTGYDREALLGRHVSALLEPEDVQRAEDAVADLLAEGDGAVDSIEFEVERADGDMRICQTNLALVPYEAEFQGVVGVMRDVTEARRREQRIAVLDRVLRHNIRNEMNLIVGHATAAADVAEGAAADSVEAIQDVAEDLLALSEDAREFKDALNPRAAETEAFDVARQVRTSAEKLERQHPGVAIAVNAPEEVWAEANDSVGLAIDELMENAVVHNDEPRRVTVSVTEEGERVEVQVADNGPGLPEPEQQVLTGGSETPLEHASRLGLWLVSWSVHNAGGSLSFRENAPRGSVVTVDLRAATPPDGGESDEGETSPDETGADEQPDGEWPGEWDRK